MTTRHSIAAAVLAFVAGLAVFTLLTSGDRAPQSQAATPTTARGHAAQAAALLQRARETGEPSVYVDAERSIRAALAADPRDPSALTAAASLAASRHHFTRALALARRAHAAAPYSTAPLGIIVDANVELGRLRRAAWALQQMVDRKPTLAAYSRVSYLRELHGDIAGAEEAMRMAVSAGGNVGEHGAGAQALLAHLYLAQGRLDAAQRTFLGALAVFPGHRPSLSGLAAIAAARGDLDGAIRRYRALVEDSASPGDSVALGETQLAAGDKAAAQRSFTDARRKFARYEAAGFDVRGELAELEADHGDAVLALRLARGAYRAASNGHHAEAVGWALTRAGRPVDGLRWLRASVADGGGDAHAHYHAAIAARDAGKPELARRWLVQSLEGAVTMGPLNGQRAREALREL